MNTEEQDKQLWQIAKLRSEFKGHLATYFLVNAFLIGVWYFTEDGYGYFWPKWVLLGWGIGIVSHYVKAYYANDIFSTQKEYDKLKNNPPK